MKKTKLLTSLAALALVLGLGACETTSEETSSEESGEVTTTTEETSGGETTSGSTSEGDTSENTSEGNTSEGGEEESQGYYFGFDVNGVDYYITGDVVESNGKSYDYEGAITTDVNKAALVYVKNVQDNAYYLTFTSGEATRWITIVETQGTDKNGNETTYYNLSYATEAALIYRYTTDEGTSYWGDETGGYFLCYYSTYACLYSSAVSYMSSSPIAELILPSDVTEITISGPTSVYVEATITLTAKVNAGADASLVEWKSDNEQVATVEAGVVTGVAAADSVTITAYVGDVSATYAIEVLETETNPEELICSFDFANGNNTSTSELAYTAVQTYFDNAFSAGESTSNPLTITACTKAYAVAGGGNTNTNLQLSTECLKLGSSGNAGSVTITSSVSVSKIVVKATCWASSGSNASCTLTINGTAISLSQAANNYSTVAELQTDTFTFTSSTELSISTNNRGMIFTMELYS